MDRKLNQSLLDLETTLSMESQSLETLLDLFQPENEEHVPALKPDIVRIQEPSSLNSRLYFSNSIVLEKVAQFIPKIRQANFDLKPPMEEDMSSNLPSVQIDLSMFLDKESAKEMETMFADESEL